VKSFDLVTVAFSKGLGAPGGSMMAGSRDLIERADRFKRILGGAMRQIGIFAAAADYALDHNLDRLPDDHANARALGETLAQSDRLLLDLATVQSNMVVFHLTDDAPATEDVVARAGAENILTGALGPRMIRLVTHLDISDEGAKRAGEVLLAAIHGN
jgi:threonine aldolase